MQRFVGAVGAVAVAAVVNVATGFLTDHGSTRWWVSAAVLLVVGVAVQWWLPTAPARRIQSIEDSKVGGRVTQTSTGPTEQKAHRNEIRGDLDQRQDG
ncbi:MULTISPECIES: hypothetical protein [unclassified Streptomyces]|uniref:hypothetical protein n=1 Tax=unclassified Streptomyces TaxID=2593676 RepID=UPI000B8100E2|nr:MULTISPECIES: hypothetical protein [unclassified Streptomyces]MYR75224.1 hypothetical protein [Streptomyces sp. SID4925]